MGIPGESLRTPCELLARVYCNGKEYLSFYIKCTIANHELPSIQKTQLSLLEIGGHFLTEEYDYLRKEDLAQLQQESKRFNNENKSQAISRRCHHGSGTATADNMEKEATHCCEAGTANSKTDGPPSQTATTKATPTRPGVKSCYA